MKTAPMRFGSFVAGVLLTATSSLLFSPAVQAQTTVLHTYTETFDSLTVGEPLHGQGGWSDANTSSTRDKAIVMNFGEGNNVFRIIRNNYAYRAVTQTHAGEANALSLSWTQRALQSPTERSDLPKADPSQFFGANLAAGVDLISGTSATANDNRLLAIRIQRDPSTGYNYDQVLQYTEWNGTANTFVTIPRVGEGAFAPNNSTTYAFSVAIDLENHSYSFSISDAASSSVVWTSPEAIALNPGADFPKYLRLHAFGGGDGGAAFDDVVLQQLHVSAIPEPGAFAAISGLVLFAFAALRRR